MKPVEFAPGERIIAYRKPRSGEKIPSVRKAYIGTSMGPYTVPGWPSIPAHIRWDNWDDSDPDFPPGAPSFDNWDMRRIDEAKLRGDEFEKILAERKDLLGRLASSSDLMGRALALHLLEDTNKYLEQRNKELDRQKSEYRK